VALYRSFLCCNLCGERVLVRTATTEQKTQGTLPPIPKDQLKALIQTHRCPPHTDRTPYRHEQERWILGYRTTEPMPFDMVHEDAEDDINTAESD
jgi:hypothetical protein